MGGRIKKKRKFESVLAVAEPSTSTGEAIHIPARQCMSVHIYTPEKKNERKEKHGTRPCVQ